MDKLHSGHVEVLVARLLGYRKNTIVPNVSWGLGLNHECDLLVLDGQDRFTEIEIKISQADFRADFKKGHSHRHRYISRLVYAMPLEIIEKNLDRFPPGVGIIAITGTNNMVSNPYPKIIRYAQWYRQVKHKKGIAVPPDVIRKFMELGCMRIWSLKEHNNRKRSLKPNSK